MTTYISRKFPMLSREEANQYVRDVAKSKYQPKTIIHVETVRYGETRIVAEDLAIYYERKRDMIMSPSGSVYLPTDQKIGIVTQLVTDQLKRRSQHKKAMLQAKAVGDTTTEMQHYFAQTTIKINVNSLPGGMGSMYNVFYDKGNYNSITSSARALIAQAYTTAETVLGGNFAWFSEEELINHIMIHITDGIDRDKLRDMMNRHHLRWPTRVELYEFYRKTIQQYHPSDQIPRVKELINTMTAEEVAFFWYFQNLRHLIWGNENIFRPWLNDLFDLTKIEMRSDVVPDDLFKIDKDLIAVIAVSFNELFSTDDDTMQVYDFPSKRPDLAKKFVSIAHYVQEQLDGIRDLFDMFIYTRLNTPRINLKKHMFRNTVILSDTDSVIFTAKDWVEWYTGDYFKLTTKTYQISSCAIYWLTKAISHCLAKYSVAHGATGEFIKIMEMKNEFLYPTMIVYSIKKTYAGQIKIQEGVILNKLATDIKGVQLRGSDVCATATKFVEDFLVKHVLEKANGRLSAAELIGTVVKFEQQIRKSVLDGETEFFKMLSIKMERDYATPTSSNYFYLMAWQEIFAQKYGDIQPPTKTAIAFLYPPTEQYYTMLEDMDKRLAKSAREFYLKYKRHPASICINPQLDRVPKELIPLIDIRSIIYHNVKALYLTLTQLGISVGSDDKKLLLSDLYTEDGVMVI